MATGALAAGGFVAEPYPIDAESDASDAQVIETQDPLLVAEGVLFFEALQVSGFGTVEWFRSRSMPRAIDARPNSLAVNQKA